MPSSRPFSCLWLSLRRSLGPHLKSDPLISRPQSLTQGSPRVRKLLDGPGSQIEPSQFQTVVHNPSQLQVRRFLMRPSHSNKNLKAARLKAYLMPSLPSPQAHFLSPGLSLNSPLPSGPARSGILRSLQTLQRQVETLGFQHLDLDVTLPRASWPHLTQHEWSQQHFLLLRCLV